MIVDCTMFHWEFDLLELRMKELWETVDYFVVTESLCDHRGKPRELLLQENLSRFDWASEKLIHYVSERPQHAKKSWDFEKFQRNSGIKFALDNLHLQPDDLVLMGDIDEIFRPSAVRQMAEERGRYRVHMPMYYYYVNLFVQDWYLPKACTVSHLDNPSEMRNSTSNDFYYVYMGGWHFSYLGSPEEIQYKLKTFAHDEFDSDSYTNINNIKSSIANKSDLFHRFGDHRFEEQRLDDSWPQYILNNIVKYKDFIL